MMRFNPSLIAFFLLWGCFGSNGRKSPLNSDVQNPSTNNFQAPDMEITLAQTRLGDRHFVYSVAQKVFGPNFNQNDRAYQYLYNKQSEYGGNCDLYERSLSGFTSGPQYEFRHNHCYTDEWNKTLLGVSTSVREGWRLKYCEETMKFNSQSVSYAFDKANVNRFTASVTYNEVEKLFKLFYPTDSLPSQTFDIILEESANFQNVEQFWKSLLLIFCTSPDWQVP